MILSVQFPEADKLLWEMFDLLPEGKRSELAGRVNVIACSLSHPLLDGHILCSVGSNSANQPA